MLDQLIKISNLAAKNHELIQLKKKTSNLTKILVAR